MWVFVVALQLYDLFGRYGAIRQIRKGNTKETRGTAFVVYEDIYDAKNACKSRTPLLPAACRPQARALGAKDSTTAMGAPSERQGKKPAPCCCMRESARV